MGGPDRKVADRSIELETQLAKLTIDRLHVLLPVLMIAIGIALASSESLGIPLTAPIVAINGAILVIAATLYLLLRANRFPVRHLDPIAALVAVLAPITSLASEAISGVPLAMVIMLEVAASALQISSRWMFATTALIVGAWLPLGIRDGGDRVMFHVTMVIATGVVATIVQGLLRRALIRSELARIDQQKMYDQLIHAQRMEAVGTLAAGLAHDMNNILAGIMSSAELIALESEDPRVRDDCSRIVDEAERGAVLTRSLLAFSRRGQYRRDKIKLDAITTSIVPLLSRTLPKTIQIEHRGEASPLIDADVVQIGQALVNLCINGADAMNGDGKLTLARDERWLGREEMTELGLEGMADQRWAVLSVTDTGHGMDEATRSRIFEPFFTTKPIGKGTGLGLSMVYGTVQGHDGAIRVISAPGKGSTFELFIPCVEGEPTPRPHRKSADPVTSNQLVLVVDDEPLVQVATRRILERMGFPVVVASDGDEALLELAKRRDEIGLIVLDMAMPRMSGAECFRKIREESKVPILIASGYALATETQELLSMGAVAFLEKPFNASQLSSKVEQLVARGQQAIIKSPDGSRLQANRDPDLRR